mmetsp:Transcript_7875/g.19571  ORF Transcript_7875/g.19571 Transcript_7875/m.19571 type:complete len:83 (-) Transcript_7875:357-605(-)
MLKIRLKRCGRKKYPVYRIVLMNSMSKRDGRAIEEFGFYNPHNKELRLNINRVENRLKQGAKTTITVQGLIRRVQSISDKTN